MFAALLKTLRRKRTLKPDHSKRVFTRRSIDQCVGVIDGKTFPVENWSLGGLQIFGDGRRFSTGDEVEITMKFKLRERVLNIPHKGRVVRKGMKRVAFEFSPLTDVAKEAFQAVVDDTVANDFS